MRIARFGILGALMLGAIGCQSKDLGPTNANVPPLAFVRYINAVPDTFNLTVRFIDQIAFVPTTFANTPYGSEGQGGFQGLEAGTHRFRVFTYDPDVNEDGATAGTEMLVDTSFAFVAGEHYTLLHAGYSRAGQLPAQKLYIIQHTLPAENASISVLGMHAAVGLAAGVNTVDLAAGANVLGTGIAFASPAAGYGTQAVGAFTADFLQAGTATVIASEEAPEGEAGTPGGATAIPGYSIPGSVFTAILFGPSVPGSEAREAEDPFVGFFRDRTPATPAP